MIQGYPDNASAFPGDTITFRVATDAPEFRIEFFRQGPTLQDTGVKTDWLAGQPGDPHEPDADFGEANTRRDGKAVAGWAGYPFTIPDWQSGVYIAMLVEGDGNGNPNPNQSQSLDRNTPDARSGKALFVVKNGAPGVDSQVLYKVPLFTYQMYNMTRFVGLDGQVHAGAGYSFTISETGEIVPGFWVTLHRPGGGTGGTPWDAVYFGPKGNQDPLDLVSFRQTFVHWDAKMISWLEGSGFRVDYCTDMDVHNDVNLSLLSPYALVLSVGHDEYYSKEMRDHLEAFVANGGNLAFFSGNTCYWRLVFPVVVDGKPDPRFITRDAQWADTGRPEDSLTGVGFRHGGERNYPLPHDGIGYVGYQVQNTNLWPFEGAGLIENATFGKDACLVGYECDGTPFDPNTPRPVSPSFNPGDATPAGLVILGTADGDRGSWDFNGGPATMAMYNNTGTVLTGGTTDWPRLLAQGDATTAAITRNVMNRLGGNPKGLATLGNLANLICCDGFFSSDDNYRHAIVATHDGNITEIFFNPNTGQGQTIVASFNGIVDIGAFFTPDDNYRHVIVATDDGNVSEVFFNPNTGMGQTVLGAFAGVVRVAAYYSSDDNWRHVVIATSDGNVTELFYHPRFGQGQVVLGNFANLVDVAGFFSPDDNYRHAVVATADGAIWESFYIPGQAGATALVGNFPEVTKIGAFYADDDLFFRRRVLVTTAGGRTLELRLQPGFASIRSLVANTNPLLDIGGFFSSDDGYRHGIIATGSGDVQELFYNP
jgi:hypothetical protein